MIISGIDRCIISVPDLENALTFYRDTVGMSEIAGGTVDNTVLHDLWGLPGNVTAQSAILRNKKQPTALELVEFDPTPTTSARDGAAVYDYGFFNVIYLVPDAEKIRKIVDGLGYKWLTKPYHYPPMWSGSRVIEAWFYGPAREVVAVIEYVHPPLAEERRLDGDWWTFFSMAQFVEDMEQGVSFYRDALGLKLISDSTPDPGFLDEPLHLPDNTELRVCLFNHADSNGSILEVVQTSAKGKRIPSTVNQLGIIMLTFESDNLEVDLAAISSGGFTVLSGPVQVETSLHGKVIASIVEGPGRTHIELFQQR
jgi:catechol 2,3-dioxygenase-like lactoylglutathione lyase family enzyme